ncbi:hypothetical protein [Methanobrevibacter curvatus]|uniref:Uncharacterized protein n=1 Tax=Methanobrevibacter curvatus TaxID=49547 RepID=A0A166EE30_9EURY|nr:hypothetical protein [Methanobrevibacter curvatus]KZX16551.1 hypothetical protein MBCUR_00430 [Methanobrevibacter curvatus]
MGLFSKKEKTSEEKLADELVGLGWGYSVNLNSLKNELSTDKRIKLQDTVKEVLKNGGSVEDIQKAYDDTLAEIRMGDVHRDLANYTEKELVDELVGADWSFSTNIYELKIPNSEKKGLQKAVKEVWKNGGSVEDIQKAYDEIVYNKIGLLHTPKGLVKYNVIYSRNIKFLNAIEYSYNWTSTDGRNYEHIVKTTLFKILSFEDILEYFKSQNDKYDINNITLADDSALLISRKEWLVNTPYFVLLKKYEMPFVVYDNGQVNFDNWEEYFVNLIN